LNFRKGVSYHNFYKVLLNLSVNRAILKQRWGKGLLKAETLQTKLKYELALRG
jgi:hypothetical protein